LLIVVYFTFVFNIFLGRKNSENIKLSKENEANQAAMLKEQTDNVS
jgi:hypothetical protein